MQPSRLVAAWEGAVTFRSRVRKQISWLQWPIFAKDEGQIGEEEKIDVHPASTKAVELNADALISMMDYYHGSFIDIDSLQAEAGRVVTSLCWVHRAAL